MHVVECGTDCFKARAYHDSGLGREYFAACDSFSNPLEIVIASA